MPGTLTWPIVRRSVDEVVLVTEEEVREAMRFLLVRLKLVVEPTGAVATVIPIGKLRRHDRKVGAILSGGTVALDVLCEVLTDNLEIVT